ncbi:MspA family porin [Rhodococcus sp. USK10]|uniref:MspA family porin n=1 Tax=Rhodococcus sp. USK10 TaxID=2789739 RepID=UPI001C5E8821|nr:MspA family porin [Rhodococcus sp. USK10]QYB07467.1 MspA family porin [Rhodococcus sp. USK10]
MINNRKNGVRLAAVGAAAAATMGFFSVGAAQADTFVPLPGGSTTQTLADGTVVTVNLTGESANISPSLGSTPLHRNVWVSGKASVNLQGNPAKTAYIYPGYILACQVDFGAGVGGNAGASVTPSQLATGTASIPASGGANGGVTLGPGQAVDTAVLDIEMADAYGSEIHWGAHYFQGEAGSVAWSDSTLGVSGCAGYAQARSYVKVEVETESVKSTVTLWGQPFSIG